MQIVSPLQEMGVSVMGDIIAILRQAKAHLASVCALSIEPFDSNCN